MTVQSISTLKAIFAAGGIVAVIILAVIVQRLESRIRELIEKLEKV